MNSASLIMSKCPDEGVSIFYQSDIKHEGRWIDKGHLIHRVADELGQHLLWHKIICRAPAGTTTFGRPAYSHILCFSKGLRIDPGLPTPDVLPVMGEKAWERGMGIPAAVMIAKFIKEQTSTTTLINPFCGHGSILAAAQVMGLDAIGIERSPKRAQKARDLGLSGDLQTWT